MILFVCSSSRESAALATACNHRMWAAYCCAAIREYRSLQARIQPRVVVVRHRLIDGYSDDLLAFVRDAPGRIRPKVVVLMSADRSAHSEARQIALGADCVLHDPVTIEILLAYIARYRLPLEGETKTSNGTPSSFSMAGADVYLDEHRIARGKLSQHIAPQEVALLRILSVATNEVVPYPVLYGELFGRRFDGDTSNCRVLLCKVLNSFQLVGVKLKPFIQVIPKSGYLYSPTPTGGTAHPSMSKATVKSNQSRAKPQRAGRPRSSNR